MQLCNLPLLTDNRLCHWLNFSSPADIAPYRYPEYEEHGGEGGDQGCPSRGPGHVHTEAEEAEDRTSEYPEDAEPGLDEAGDVLHQESEEVAEDPEAEAEELRKLRGEFFLQTSPPERPDDVLQRHRREGVEAAGDCGESPGEDSGDKEAREAGDLAQDVHHEEGQELVLSSDWSTPGQRFKGLLVPALLCHKDTAQGTATGISCLSLCFYGTIIDPFRAWKKILMT